MKETTFLLAASIPVLLSALNVIDDIGVRLLPTFPDIRQVSFHSFPLYLALLTLSMAFFAYNFIGPRFLASALLVFLGGGFLLEVVGITFGIPFGGYSYSTAFRPQLLKVPLEVPATWFVLGVMCFSIVQRSTFGRFARVALATSLLVSWDILYDPIYASRGAWHWTLGGYFGVPLSNFFGWTLVGILFFGLCLTIRGSGDLPWVAEISATVLYVLYAVDGVVITLNTSLQIPGILGFGLMSSVLLFTKLLRPASVYPWIGGGRRARIPEAQV
ncbi:MAG TPA: carotenoid biosynthesis protein [Nitrososphaerales archaeon]|nr:carotenoid biosynthesis protein [Nitrososphaerales archaeon]